MGFLQCCPDRRIETVETASITFPDSFCSLLSKSFSFPLLATTNAQKYILSLNIPPALESNVLSHLSQSWTFKEIWPLSSWYHCVLWVGVDQLPLAARFRQLYLKELVTSIFKATNIIVYGVSAWGKGCVHSEQLSTVPPSLPSVVF